MAAVKGGKKRGTAKTETQGSIKKKRIRPKKSRERIFVFGEEGCGKSSAWLSIAEAYPDVKFFVIDTDDAVERMLETDYSELDNVELEVVEGWEEFDEAVSSALEQIDEIGQELGPNAEKWEYPWLIVDFADATWDMVQSYFTEQVFNKGIAEFFLQARKHLRDTKGQLQPLEGWTDWQVINKLFQGVWKKITHRGGPFNLYITAKATSASGKEAKSIYRGFSVMPGGEKRMGYRVHTILLASAVQKKKQPRTYYLDTVKDRGRGLLEDTKVSNFAVTYLVRTAGWELPE